MELPKGTYLAYSNLLLPCSFLLERSECLVPVYSYNFVLQYAKSTHSETKGFNIFAEYLLVFAVTQILTSPYSSADFKQPRWWGVCAASKILTGNHSPSSMRADNLTSTCQYALRSLLCCSGSTEHMGKACSILACHPIRYLYLGSEPMTRLKEKSVHLNIFFSLKGLIQTLCARWENYSYPRLTILFSSLGTTTENQCTLVSPSLEL